ncbi:DNA-directed RNA polymerase subunit beta' [Spiroplasma endosymbiont of Megaselia nigra]|uniref:DNA-directed RNA polymerase subunit beta' n=1 Tax=Spiroplasma endosymbiont of Megaselia nigra TaxID=2478537 RepID=UPI000F86D8E4|nr:DNA-directed RNA polymerase subunit beta' [Spiroplasma endosymbiont of Megaselia nigra]RUO86753.1 DNA-directed RNA polymerase subunit beta' [Spiroplasma endosymbiont of Megaselia nigra]
MIENNEKNNLMIKIGLANPDDIRSWSYGEVKKPETINYKTLKPERDGLFDEKIFGPTKNFECACGKYKKSKNKGKICERCGVEITEAIVRRERMGHIELEEPVTHIWMLKAAPSRIALILDMKTKELEEVVYFVSYIVLDGGDAKSLKQKMVLDLGNAKTSAQTRQRLTKTLREILDTLEPNTIAYEVGETMIEDLKNTSLPFSMDECAQFINRHTNARFGIGAEAVEVLLKNLNIDDEIEKIKQDLKDKKTQLDQNKLMKRLEVLDSLKKSGSRPEWMILRALPVIPPDIRPIIQLDGGRFTTSEINDLYRRIIIRNERLKKVKAMGAPGVIVNNEKRMLQEAVDALLDNERKARPVTGKDKRPLKSLTSILKGKQGRFRQNLLGKRVDYSGRSVIAIGPDLKMYQCGLPRDMAITLFKPFVISKLVKDGLAANIKVAEKLILNQDDKVWEVLEEVIKTRPVLLNRAPTLHRLGIQAFESKLVKGKAIRLHPLVTTAFNADFDGDQMAVHVPITEEAVAEARSLMLGSRNILGPKDGKPIVTPTQDMVLGNYYLTYEEKGQLGEGTIFKDLNEAVIAYETGAVALHALVAIPVVGFVNKKFKPEQMKDYIITTPGKIIFNQIFKEEFPYLNEPNVENLTALPARSLIKDNVNLVEYLSSWKVNPPFKKKDLSNIIDRYFKQYGANKTAEMLDNMKNLGFKYSGKSGVTVSAGDVKVYDKKQEEFKAADQKVKEINDYFKMGMLTSREKQHRIIIVWSKVKDNIQTELEHVLREDPKNPIFMMADSGARGNVSNFTQLVGMRGLMNNPKGDIIELPIKSSFREGLTVSEFFISTHGARKGMADVALKTADSGYLTRRLVDVSQEIIITVKDCNARRGFIVSDIIEQKHANIIVPLFDRLVGRYNLKDIKLKNGEVIAANTLLTEEDSRKIVDNDIKEVIIRSVLTCEAEKGVCQRCYGKNLATGMEVEIGEAVGTIAAQSIGEPGTQLTMRTFHTGGVAGGADITQGLPRIKELLDVTTPKGSIAVISEIDGKISDIRDEGGIHTIYVKSDSDERKYKTQYNAVLRVKIGDKVARGQKLTEGSINIKELLEVAKIEDVHNYILKEVQRVYRLQGIEISDKYIEIIIKQMLNKVKIIDAGDTELLPGEIVTIKRYRNETIKAVRSMKKPPRAKHVIFGIKKAPLESESFLSSASFQDTTRVLVKAIIKGKVDCLEGLKENIMLGHLIPAGTGLKNPKDIITAGIAAKAEEY